MIILREKSFGQVKRENKAKKRAWEEKVGKDHIRESYQKYLDDAKKVGYSNPLDISDYGKEKLRGSAESIISRRKSNNSFDDNKVKALPKIGWDEAARGYGRGRLYVDSIEDELENKSIYGGKSYYKPKLDRVKFNKIKDSNEKTLIDFLNKEKNRNYKNSLQEEEISLNKKQSIPLTRKIKRLFKKNINKLIK